MTEYFGRVYELKIGDEDGAPIVIDGFIDNPYQLTFMIDQTPSSHLAYAEITIYGLSKSTRQKIRQQYDTVNLVAGWTTLYCNIFRGQIVNVETGREGADPFVRLFCRSAAVKWDEFRVNRTFGPGATFEEMLRFVAQSFGYPVDFIGDFSDLPKSLRGEGLQGDAKEVMRQLQSMPIGDVPAFDWYIDSKQRMKVVRSGSEREDSDTYTFTPANGLIGTPEIKINGVDVDVLLNPRIRPYDLYAVESETAALTFNSIYYKPFEFPRTSGESLNQVIAIRHEGDYYGDTWQTSLEGIRAGSV